VAHRRRNPSLADDLSPRAKPMDISTKLKRLGERFRGRLPNDRLKFALDYIVFNENALAFETLCADICEFDTRMTKEEYDEITSLNWSFKSPLGKNTMLHLKHLVFDISRE
jgi:hypothetical protein